MAETDIRTDLYERLLAVKPDGMTLNAWRTAAGVNRNVFSDIRSSGNARHDTLDKLLRAAGISFADFEAAGQLVKTEVVAAGPVGNRDVRTAFYGEKPTPALPLLGTAAGGEHEDVDLEIEMIEVHLGEVLAYLSRPASLVSDKDAYALTIVGDSMWPRYKPREMVAVSPRATVSIGDDVIVQLRGIEGEDERIKMVLVKELVKSGPTFVELRQYNPEKIFRIDRKRVAAMHLVRGHVF